MDTLSKAGENAHDAHFRDAGPCQKLIPREGLGAACKLEAACYYFQSGRGGDLRAKPLSGKWAWFWVLVLAEPFLLVLVFPPLVCFACCSTLAPASLPMTDRRLHGPHGIQYPQMWIGRGYLTDVGCVPHSVAWRSHGDVAADHSTPLIKHLTRQPAK
jgi:hypothetical protein